MKRTWYPSGMPRRARTALLAVSLLAGCVSGPRHAPARPKPQPVYAGHFSEFPSGLRLVSYQLPHATRGVVVACYAGGSADDPPGKEGLAVLAGRVAQRARPGGSARLSDRVLATGVEHGHQVTADALIMWMTGDTYDVARMLGIEADRLEDPATGITQADLDRERDALISSLSAPPGSGIAAPLVWLSQLAFAGHTYGRPTLGTPSSLAAITLADVKHWLTSHVTAAGTVLAVTSSSAAAMAEPVVASRFGRVAAGAPGTTVAPVSPPARSPLERTAANAHETRRTASSSTTLWLGWAAPAASAADRANAMRAAASAARAVAHALTGDTAQAVLAISGEVYPRGAASLIAVQIAVAEGALAGPILETALASFDRPVEVADDATLAAFAFSRPSHAFAIDIAQHVQLTGNPDLPADWLAVDVSSASAWVQDVLTRGRAVSLTIAPDPTTPARPTPLLGLVQALETTGRAFDPTPLDGDPFLVAPNDVARAIESAQVSIDGRTLPNGLAIVSIPVPDRALYARLVVRNGGRTLDEAASAAAAFFAGRTTSGWFGGRACRTAVGVDFEAAHFTFAAPRALARSVFDELGCWTERASTDDVAYDEATTFMQRSLDRASRATSVLAWDAMRAALYPGHAQSRPLAAQASAFAAATADRWMHDAMRPDHATLLLVGDVRDTATLMADAARRFGSWSSDGTAPPVLGGASLPSARRVLLLPQPMARGAHVTIAVRIPPAVERDEVAFAAGTRVLEARLSAMRAETGLAGALVTHHDSGAGSALFVSATVPGVDPSPTLTRLLSTIASVRDAPAPDGMVDRIRLELLHRARTRNTTTGRAIVEATYAAERGVPLESWMGEPAAIGALTAARIQDGARALALGREVVVVIGEAWLAEALRKSGFEVELIASGNEGS